jgi:precorrin-3B C17-methyltransferase
MEKRDSRNSEGKLFVVGIGPGDREDRTLRAVNAISASGVIVGYKVYIELIKDLTGGKTIVSSGMTHETDRCRDALNRAAQGAVVSLVSSGDAGIYGMAGLAIELAASEGLNVPIEVVPGVTSSLAAAAKLGAPLMLDFATVSLSDLLLPWAPIRARLKAVARADFVVALYNPRSKKRTRHLEEAAAIFSKTRPASTPVGIATNVGRKDETLAFSDLGNFLSEEINMRSIVIIGNRTSKIVNGRFVTPRGYLL